MTLSEVAKNFDIPLETLRSRLKNLIKGTDYRKTEGNKQPIILTPIGVAKIINVAIENNTKYYKLKNNSITRHFSGANSKFEAVYVHVDSNIIIKGVEDKKHGIIHFTINDKEKDVFSQFSDLNDYYEEVEINNKKIKEGNYIIYQ
jgi:hypothetical protein